MNEKVNDFRSIYKLSVFKIYIFSIKFFGHESNINWRALNLKLITKSNLCLDYQIFLNSFFYKRMSLV